MKIYIGKSKMHGKGIFASENIKKGEKIFIIKGEKINFIINNKQKAKLAGLNWIGYDKNTWIDPVGYGLYINHSCNPNSIIKGKVSVVALKNIKKYEEITLDYSFFESDIFWDIKCSCGNIKCRKIIKPIQFMTPKIIKKNKYNIPVYYIKIFNNYNLLTCKDYTTFKKKWINYIEN